ncbi:MAG: DUF1292 domain-containing protein [Clostridia bacterium]|nr:DUF1292 domain-containing protein [Clostridia bacterium]
MADRDNILEMVDEDGGVYEFEFLMTFEVGGDYFLAFTPTEPTGEFDQGDVLIMRIGEDEDGEEVYLPIESQEELDQLWEIFQDLYEQAMEEEEEDDV